jgi:predicted secreted hydrolase
MTAGFFDDLEEMAQNVVDSFIDAIIGPSKDLSRASEDRPIELPRDTYAHADVQTEWWYYTGHLKSDQRDFGFELVFFKRNTDKDRLGRIIPMRAISPVNYYAHFAISDIEAKQFRYAHRRSINGSVPASAAYDRHDVRLDDWRAREINGIHHISARMNYTQLELALTPVKPIVKHGLNGLSFKDDGEASYYLSYSRMAAEGELIVNGKGYTVAGTAWMDHEFGSWTMKEKIQGWDWFALQFDNGQELMAFIIRDRNGKVTRFSEATLIDVDSGIKKFSHEAFLVTPLGQWRSPVTKTDYPSTWRLEIPSLGADLTIVPALRSQELDTRGTTMVIYWEGATSVSGRLAGRHVDGRGYVELVGYDRSHEDLTLYDYFLSELKMRGLGRF